MPIEDWTPDPSGQSVGDPLREMRAPAIDLAAALSSLDQATRNITTRLGGAQDLGGLGEPRAQAPRPAPGEPATGSDPAAVERAVAERLELAEREAREYIRSARLRVDRLLATMLDAVERDGAAIRRQAEADAASRLEQARRDSDALTAERRTRLGALSDGIAVKAEALSAGLDDAERVRQQFHAFLHALSVTADQIAAEAAPPLAPSARAHDVHLPALSDVLAA